MAPDPSLLDRYLGAVRRYLPEPRQDDILAELAANLQAQMDDRSAALNHPLTEDEQAEVLRRHGHPMLVAVRYQPHRSLIGPEIFPFYWFTLERVLPLILGVYVLVQAAVIIFGSPSPDSSTIAQRLNVGQLVNGLIGALFQSAAWITLGFAAFEFLFRSNTGRMRDKLRSLDWDPRKLPKTDPALDRRGPRHPYADAIATGAFLFWLLSFPHFPMFMFGPVVAWRLLNLDLPSIWHTFYWAMVGLIAIQFATRIALLWAPIRRYYHAIDACLHLLGIGILALMLRVHDYVGQANFGGSALSPSTADLINLNVHRGLLLALVIALLMFAWEIFRWLRPSVAKRPARNMAAHT